MAASWTDEETYKLIDYGANAIQAILCHTLIYLFFRGSVNAGWKGSAGTFSERNETEWKKPV